MSSPNPNARHELGLAFGRAHRRHVAETVLFNQKAAERLALNVTDLQCLNFIDITGVDGKLTAGQLAELTGISTGAMTRLIDRLEASGLVRRERSVPDRRQVTCVITAHGLDVLRTLDALVEGSRASWTGGDELTREEQEQLVRLLERVRARLDEALRQER
mgnify:CR=1 FL=1